MKRVKPNREGALFRRAAVIVAGGALVAASSCKTEPDGGVPRRVVEGTGQNTTYALRQIAVLSYGSGDVELGLFEAPEIGANGPESFWIDDAGQIHVCDSVNQKVKTFSPAGALVGQTPLGFAGNDLAVDERGDVFVLDRARRVVEHISPAGEKRGAIHLERHHVDTAFTLRATADQVLLDSVMQKQAVLGEMHGGTMALRASVSAPTMRSGIAGRAERRFKTARNIDHQAEIDVFDQGNHVIDRLLLPLDNVASVVFLGEDRAGNNYYQLELSDRDGGVSLSVYCLDQAGNLDSVIENIPNNYYVWTAKLLQVADSGDIYQMLPTDKAVELNVWERQ